MEVNAMPPPDLQMPEKLGARFDEAEQKLRKARKNRKARKKIKESHFQQIQQGKVQSVGASQRGVSQHRAANDTYQRTPEAQQAAKGGELWKPLKEQEVRTSLAGGEKSAGAAAAAGYAAPALVAAGALGNVAGMTDIDQLAGMLGTRQGQNGQLMEALARIGQDMKSQTSTNQKISQTMQQYARLEQSFGAKEQSYLGQFQTFTQISKTLAQVGRLLHSASQSLEAASMQVEAQAQACLSIPFAGPILYAILKAVAVTLKVAAMGLKKIGMFMEKMSQQMQQTARQMRQLAEKMKVQKLENQARKLAEKVKLEEGMRRLQQIQQARQKAADALGINVQDQVQLVERMNQLGRKARVSGGGRSGAGLNLQQVAEARMPGQPLTGNAAAGGAGASAVGASPASGNSTAGAVALS
ncbi:MAG: hypothetical protein AB1758_32750, partial [Candidatus Eremiobacterota bacterium]